MKKLSFKEPLENRQCIIELELKNETFIIKCCPAAVGSIQEDSSVYDLFRSMIRNNDNIEEIMKVIDYELDNEQLIEVIMAVNEQLILKKKSIN